MSTPAEREEANRAYLKNYVDVHLNKLIIELLKKKPDNVLEFIQTWSGESMAQVDGDQTKEKTVGDDQGEPANEQVVS